jgi:hypothetical protein
MTVCFSAYAEETVEKHEHIYETYEKSQLLWDTPDGEKEITHVYRYSFFTTEEKQPLMFQDTEDNPKTGFSRLSLEEILQFPDGKIEFAVVYDGDKVLETAYDSSFIKNNLLELEKLFVYEEQDDGTIKRVLRTKKTAKKDENNKFTLSYESGEKIIMFEQMASILIEDFAQGMVVNTNVKGTGLDRLRAMFTGNGDFTRLYWIPKKTPERLKEDQEYIRDALLSLRPGREFDEAYSIVYMFFEKYVYMGKNNQYFIRIQEPTKAMKKLYSNK